MNIRTLQEKHEARLLSDPDYRAYDAALQGRGCPEGVTSLQWLLALQKAAEFKRDFVNFILMIEDGE